MLWQHLCMYDADVHQPPRPCVWLPDQSIGLCILMQVDGRSFYAAGTNGYALALVSDGKQYGFTDAALEKYFAEQVLPQLSEMEMQRNDWMMAALQLHVKRSLFSGQGSSYMSAGAEIAHFCLQELESHDHKAL